ncbi:hypothetical protein SCEN_K00800 [Saccharomyces cerevisiae]|nr:hypothetical protein SCEN_K00800 [Saccharomyces cerevisiae]
MMNMRHERLVNFEIIVGIPMLIKAVILCIQNILEVSPRGYRHPQKGIDIST